MLKLTLPQQLAVLSYFPFLPPSLLFAPHSLLPALVITVVNIIRRSIRRAGWRFHNSIMLLLSPFCMLFYLVTPADFMMTVVVALPWCWIALTVLSELFHEFGGEWAKVSGRRCALSTAPEELGLAE